MKRLFSYLMILLLLFPTVVAEEEYEEFGEDFDNALDKIEKTAKTLKDLIEKYEKKELEVIKTEDITIVDQNGNGVACDLNIYYDNYHAIKMKTGSNGKYTGDFRHAKTWPKKPISVNIHGCKCRIEDFEHKTSFPQFDVHIEKIRGVISDEAQKYAGDKAKDAAKKLVEKGFESAGASNLAGPFLWGFKAGADLGAPFGQALTDGINKILDARLDIRKAEHEAGSIAPRGEPKTARWKIPVLSWFQTKPVLKNTWKVNVVCGNYNADYSSLRWREYDEYKISTRDPPSVVTPPKTDEEIAEEEAEDKAQQEWEEQQRKWEEERKQRDEEEKRKREEERKKREQELQEQAAKIKEECKICDPIRADIQEALDKMKELQDRLNELDGEISDAEGEASKAKRKLDRARSALDRFNNPSSWAESDGRRVTSSDLAIDRMVAQGAWQRYRDGEIDADQLQDEWENYDDATREAAKKAYKKKLEQDIKDAEAKWKEAEDKVKEKKAERSRKSQSLANLKKHLEDLYAKLEECLKKCKEKAMDIAKGRITDWSELIEKEEKPVTTTRPVTGMPTTRSECDKYNMLIGKYRVDASKAASMSEVDWLERGMSESMYKAMLQYKKRCDQTSVVSTQKDYVTTGPKTEVVETAEPKSCSELCSERGRSTSKQDWTSYILGELNSKGVCAASASIGLPTILKVNDCTCYSKDKPTVQISSQKLVCKGTPCGDVACGSSTECSCGPDCIQTVSCNWGGWRKVGEAAYQPVVG